MLQTKFTFKAFIPVLVLIPILYLIKLILPGILKDDEINTPLFIIIFIPTFLIFIFILMFGELRTKCIILIINKNEIIVKRFFGLTTKTYKISEIDGWKYSHLSSKGGTYEYLYLYNSENKVVKISQFYHKNYFKVKNYIQGNFKYLGYEKLSYIDEFKEIFK